ncbi:MAG TPA: hypothetical protein VGB64_02570 [Actinomycetota bacterium]
MPRPHDPSGGLTIARCRDNLAECARLIMRADADVWAAAEAVGELNRLSVIFEEKIVRKARSRGLSWDRLAFLMGTSRQALHSRWRRRLQGDTYDPKSGLSRKRWEEKYGRE